MFVHVNSEWFVRRPVRTVVLGVIALAVWSVLVLMLFREYRGFGSTPAHIDLNKIVPPAENHGKWVQIDQSLHLRCDLTWQEVRQPPESWFLGGIDQTFFVASIEGGERNLLLVYEGDVHCGNAQKRPLEGVLEEINSRRRSYLSGENFVFPSRTDLQLSVGEGPASYRKLLLWSSFLPVISIFLIIRFWPKWRAEIRRSEDLTAKLIRPYSPKAF